MAWTGPDSGATHTYTYPDPGQPHPHALESVTANGPGGTSIDTYAYDDTGNTTSRDITGDTQTLEWGTEGHLESTDSPSGDTSYVYNTEGGRLIRHDNTGDTLYLGAMEVHANTSGQVTATRYYTHNGTTIAQRAPQGLTWLTTDHHGTPDLVIDEATVAPTHRYFDPFGNPRGNDVTWPDDHGYLNAPTDTTGLTHLGAREYGPTIGRFITVDPLISTQNPQQLNGYTYANNNPTTFADPTGQLCTNGPDGMCKPVVGGNNGKSELVSSGISRVISHPGTANWKRHTINITLPNGTNYYDDGHTRTVNGLPYSGNRLGAYASELDGAIVWSREKYGQPVLGFDLAGLMLQVCESHLGDLCGDELYDVVFHHNDLAQRHAGLIIGSDYGQAMGAPRIGSVGDGELGKGGRCNSFLPGTKVLLANGTHKPLRELKLGDQVINTDPITGNTATSKIVGTVVGRRQEGLVRIDVESGRSKATLTATINRPFWVDYDPQRLGPNIPNGHWKLAGRLKPGDRLGPGRDRKTRQGYTQVINARLQLADRDLGDRGKRKWRRAVLITPSDTVPKATSVPSQTAPSADRGATLGRREAGTASPAVGRRTSRYT